MDTEQIKQLATDVNSAIIASTEPLYEKIRGLQAELEQLRWIPVEKLSHKQINTYIEFMRFNPSGEIEGGICWAQGWSLERIKRNYTHWKPIILPEE